MTEESKSEDQNSAESELGFSAAMEELERILAGIEDERIDIDVLGRELQRAAGLLELCRAKIRRAETEVSQIVQGLESGGGEVEPEEETGDDAGTEDDASAGEELPF